MLITGAHSFIGKRGARAAGGRSGRGGRDGERARRRVAGRSTFPGTTACCTRRGLRTFGRTARWMRSTTRSNHRLTADLAARAKASGVGQFIFLSSIIVFGEASPAGVRWRSALRRLPAPANAYGAEQARRGDALRGLAGDGFRVAILRLPMVYGRGCKGNYNALARLAQRLPVFPEFDNRRSVLYVGNLAELVRRAALDGAEGTFSSARWPASVDGRRSCAPSAVRTTGKMHFQPGARAAGAVDGRARPRAPRVWRHGLCRRRAGLSRRLPEVFV